MQAVSEVSNNDFDLDHGSGHQVYFYYFFDVYTLEYSEGFSEKNTSEEVSTKQLLAHSHYKYVMAHAPLCALAWYIILAQVLSGGLSMGSVSVTTAASLLVKISSLTLTVTLPLWQLIQYWHKQSMRKTFKTVFVISTQQIQSGQITRKITKCRKAKINQEQHFLHAYCTMILFYQQNVVYQQNVGKARVPKRFLVVKL